MRTYIIKLIMLLISNTSFLIGFGPFRKRGIVLSSNLISCLTINEILAVVGHEIGHFKFNRNYYSNCSLIFSKDLYKKLAVQVFFIGNFIFLFSHVINSKAFYVSFLFNNAEVIINNNNVVFTFVLDECGNHTFLLFI